MDMRIGKQKQRGDSMKTGAICDIEYFMKNCCRGCKLSRLCEEKEQKDREKNEIRKEVREQLQKKRTE
jgi:hypothetical protein